MACVFQSVREGGRARAFVRGSGKAGLLGGRAGMQAGRKAAGSQTCSQGASVRAPPHLAKHLAHGELVPQHLPLLLAPDLGVVEGEGGCG